MRIFVTGGTGLVGRRLVKSLVERGDQVTVLSRHAGPAGKVLGDKVTVVEGDPVQAGPWMAAVDDCDAVVHLAGENVFAKRWSASFKNLLVSSRVQSTSNIATALLKQPRRPD